VKSISRSPESTSGLKAADIIDSTSLRADTAARLTMRSCSGIDPTSCGASAALPPMRRRYQRRPAPAVIGLTEIGVGYCASCA
jgi:hypothetical protein